MKCEEGGRREKAENQQGHEDLEGDIRRIFLVRE
jgi:hypothetical protein